MGHRLQRVGMPFVVSIGVVLPLVLVGLIAGYLIADVDPDSGQDSYETAIEGSEPDSELKVDDAQDASSALSRRGWQPAARAW